MPTTDRNLCAPVQSSPSTYLAWALNLLFIGLSGGLSGCVDAPDPALLGSHEREAIYGADDRMDVYAHPDAALKAIAQDSVVALMQGRTLDLTDLSDIGLVAQTLGQANSLCTGERFFDDPTAAFCSATLIDDDLVLTAGHCMDSPSACRSTVFVFNYHHTAQGQLATIAEEDVFTCREVVAQRLDLNSDPSVPSLDYAIVQLDRPATPRFSPVSVRTAAAALTVNDPVSIIGFGSGVPAKIDDGGHVTDPRATVIDRFVSTTDSFGGNSGSAILDANQQIVGILVSGEEDYIWQGFCAVTARYPANGQGAGEWSTYAHHAVEDLCDQGWSSAALCAKAAICGDGKCNATETFANCPADCPNAVCGDGVCDQGEWTTCDVDCAWGAPLPPGWMCAPEYYAAGDGCDCGCGALDPDCNDPTQPVYNCAPGQSCDAFGECTMGNIPPGWTCPPNFYDALDGCDCECGVYDPDCDDRDQSIYGCGPGQICNLAGRCESIPTPPGWTCRVTHYGTNDGCDCACGAYDPDCADPWQEIYNCPAGYVCDLNGACVTDPDPVPPGWVCPDPMYAGGNACDCECGVYDPDCDNPFLPVFGCGPGQTCDPAGRCTGGIPIPPDWYCPPEFYATFDGCDCECGAYDPDCNDPSQPVYNCGPGQTCDAVGMCTGGTTVPPGWFCPVQQYGTFDGCNCGCGAWDPDCDDPFQPIFGCAAGQACVRPNGQCSGGVVVPPGWSCPTEWYGTYDGCDCECGAWDPDCDVPSQPLYGCGPGQICEPPQGRCSGGIPVPPEWFCPPNWYATQNGCDCQCGTWDPDCADPFQPIYGCGPGQTCDPFGQCSGGVQPPPDWFCDPSLWASGWSCDCACGAPDPDCQFPGIPVSGCRPGQQCGADGVCHDGVPPDWWCEPWRYAAFDGCDCECGTWDPDCNDPFAPVNGCGMGDRCSPPGFCIPGGEIPPDWFCPYEYYGTFDGCDCECGAWDPDCGDPTQPIYGCAEGATCDAFGHCAGGPIVPPDWFCPYEYYGTGDGCDCECGTWDPDCGDPTQPIYGCSPGQTCNPAGHCSGGGIPPGWSCPIEFYGTRDGCDCACGALDPDCGDPTQPVLNCSVGETCSPQGTCVGSSVPPGWQCAPGAYATLDGCNCACGVPDPDCLVPGQLVIGCGPDEVCSQDRCVRPDVIPAAWNCAPADYWTGGACDCGCGAYDPDCDDVSLEVSGCAAGQRCNASGRCSGGDAPAQWTCEPLSYAANDGCDCDCGAYDPDCDDASQALFGCSRGQLCTFDGVCVTPGLDGEVLEADGFGEDPVNGGCGCRVSAPTNNTTRPWGVASLFVMVGLALWRRRRSRT